MTSLIGQEIAYAGYNPHTQVFKATHISKDTNNGDANWQRDSFMNRSFISFSFGGKYIEDYDLIAVIDGDRMNKSGSASFEDLTSTYDVVNGQFYWGTHFINNQLRFQLATDGITQNKLDDFLHWFCGGETRELILSEHPNRAIMARVAEPPGLSFIPFEEKTTVIIQDKEYETSTTLYKGEIDLTFVTDEPFWYSKVNIFSRNENGNWVDEWEDANGNTVSVYDDKDALKIIKEDGVPVAQMFQATTLLGNNLMSSPDFTVIGNNSPSTGQNKTSPIKVQNIAVAATNAENTTIENAIGIVGPLISTNSSSIINAGQNNVHLYYPGNAPVSPTISFSFTPVLENTTSGSIIEPKNNRVSSTTPFSSIFFESTNIYRLDITLPSVYSGYQKAIDIMESYQDGYNNMTEIRTRLRDEVKHKAARAWAVAVIDSMGSSFQLSNAKNLMSYFLKDLNSDTILPSYIMIDCKKGIATGVLGYRKVGTSIPGSSSWGSWGTIENVVINGVNYRGTQENVGDMIYSDYITLKDRNYLNERGQINPWNAVNGKTNCYRIYHNFSKPLTNFSISYKYMYY